MVPPPPQRRTSAKTKKPSVLAPASLLDGLGCRHYQLATRGNAYGKGAAYRHFPEASLITQINNQ